MKKHLNDNMELVVRRLMGVTVPKAEGDEGARQDAMVVAMLKNAQSLGFTFSASLADALAAQDPEYLTAFYRSLIGALRSLVGADVKYEPFYPNFPAQVAEASEAELVINALVHYATSGALVPDYPKDERFPLVGEPRLKEIGLVSEDDVMGVFTNLLGASAPTSAQDQADVRWFVDNTDYRAYLPEKIPMKETRAFFAALMCEKGDSKSASALCETATDVLRFLAAISGQDVSLSSAVRFRKLKRKERKFVMDLLAGCGGSLVEDMFRYRGLWVAVGEIVHPGEYSRRPEYREVVKAFDAIREDDKPLFFAGKVETAIAVSDWRRAAALLSSRPGEFARRLDQLLRIPGADADAIVSAFSAVAGKVSTRVLWQAKAHFDHRGEKGKRAFFPKGNEAKCRVIEDELAMLPKETCAAVSAACYAGILEQYAKKEPMGDVYVDPAFAAYAAPFTQRGSSAGFRQVARGSRVPLGEKTKIVRPFIWWTNREDGERVDVDLAVSFLDEDMAHVSTVTYYNLRDRALGACHSGDFVDGGAYGGAGASEFVDFDPARLAEAGVRYAVVQIYMYSGQPFSTLPCAFGWMEREDAESGEVYEPSTVENRIALTAQSTSAVPAIVDCLTREVIWADMTMRSRFEFGGVNAASNAVGSKATAWAIVNWEKPSLYDVVLANAIARGRAVANRDDADVIFSNDPTKPVVETIEIGDDGLPVAKKAEKDVVVRDAFDLAFYMGEI